MQLSTNLLLNKFFILSHPQCGHGHGRWRAHGSHLRIPARKCNTCHLPRSVICVRQCSFLSRSLRFAPKKKGGGKKKKNHFYRRYKCCPSERLGNNSVIIFPPRSLRFKMQTGESQLRPSVFFDFAECQGTRREKTERQAERKVSGEGRP